MEGQGPGEGAGWPALFRKGRPPRSTPACLPGLFPCIRYIWHFVRVPASHLKVVISAVVVVQEVQDLAEPLEMHDLPLPQKCESVRNCLVAVGI